MYTTAHHHRQGGHILPVMLSPLKRAVSSCGTYARTAWRRRQECILGSTRGIGELTPGRWGGKWGEGLGAALDQ